MATAALAIVSLLVVSACLVLRWNWPETADEVRRFVVRTGKAVLQVTGLSGLGEVFDDGRTEPPIHDQFDEIGTGVRVEKPNRVEKSVQVFHGSVTLSGTPRVIDGDTLKVNGVRVRLHGIDAPESAQKCIADGRRWRCGQRAASALAQRISGGSVSCKERARDAYGRMVAVCRAARTLTPGWYRRDGRWHTGGILWTMWTRRLRQELRGGAFGAAGSWSHGIGARESAWILTRRPSSGTGAGLPARELADAASRGTSAARARASITCRAAGTTRARVSAPPRGSAGSARRPKPVRRVGGGHGGDGVGTLVMQMAEKEAPRARPQRSRRNLGTRGST